METAILLEEPYGPEVGMAGGEHCYSRDTSGKLNSLLHITRSPNIRPHVDKKKCLNVNIINFEKVDKPEGVGGWTMWIRLSC